MIDSQKLYLFLNDCEGNWRNAIFIFCKSCPYSDFICPGYFLTVDSKGLPILYSIELIQKYSKEPIITDECIGQLSRQAFEALYNRWLLWQIDKPNQCSILQVLQSKQQTDTTL